MKKNETINEIVFATVNLFYHNSTNTNCYFLSTEKHKDRPLATVIWFPSSEDRPSGLTQSVPALVPRLAREECGCGKGVYMPWNKNRPTWGSDSPSEFH